MIGRPVQESSCVKTRQWPSSDKQSHNHPGAADTLGTNSKPVFAHGEEMTKTGVEEEGLAVCEMMEKVAGVEEGKMEVLCSLEGMPGSCLSQEAEPQSPTMDEHEHRPDGSTAEGHIKATDRIAGQKKVFRKRQKAKPKMQTAEAAGTEDGPQNTWASFRLQDFICFKISKHTALLLIVLLAFPVNSNETPKQRKCAVCLEKDCATGVRKIYPTGRDTAVWSKANSPTGIQTCSMENLKADAPCKMANGSLVLPADNPLHFEGIDTHDVRRVFHSQILPCADLNLPPSSTPSSGVPHLVPMTKAPIHNMPTPAATNNSVPGKKGNLIIGSIVSVILLLILCILSLVLVWKLRNRRRGQDRGHRKGNNRVPPHYAEHRDEITIKKRPLKGVLNGNFNRDDHVGTAGLLGRWDNTPV